MQPHRLITLPQGEKYISYEIDDLLTAAMLKGVFDINDVKPLHAEFFSGRVYATNNGFIDFKIKNTDTFEGQYVSLNDVSMENRVVICTNETPYEIINRRQYINIIEKNPRLVIMPISLYDHFTLLALQPQTKRAYYYDSMGRKNDDIKNWCENTLGYSYIHNTKHLQIDGTSCGPSVVNFAIHAVDCVKNNREISADGIPQFGCGIFSSSAANKEISDMLQRQKDLLYFENEKNDQVPFQTAFFNEMSAAKNGYLFFDTKEEEPVPGQWYNFPHTNRNTGPELVSKRKEWQLPLTAIGVVSGIILGVTLGYVLMHKVETATPIMDLLRMQAQEASITFTLSACIILSVVLGIAGNLSARAIETI